VVLATVSLPGRTLGVFEVPVAAGREIVLQLPADGGTLSLKLPEGTGRENQDWQLFVLRDGIPFAAHEVLHWASLYPEIEGSADRRIIPKLVAGQYEVCAIEVDQYIPWALGQRDATRCAGGSLSPLGELELTLPKLDAGGS